MSLLGKFRGKAQAIFLAILFSFIPYPAQSADLSVGSVLLYTGAGCADNSDTRIYFCLDFRNKDGGYDVVFKGMGFRWTLTQAGNEVSSGGTATNGFGSRTGTPASWGLHREEINGLNAGTNYLVTMTVTDGTDTYVRSLSITTPGASSMPPIQTTSSPEPQVPSSSPQPQNPVPKGIAHKVDISGPSQALTGESIELSLAVTDANGLAVVGKVVSLFVTGPGRVSTETVTTDSQGRATFNYNAGNVSTGFATVYASADSVQGQKSIEVTPASSNAGRFGGYAVVHPSTGVVCGVVVATEPQIMSIDYMGCPAGSQTYFQTKPSRTGNVAGYHGPDVTYRSGTFYLTWGTITDGIATDNSGRVWDTGTGETLVAGSGTSTPPATNPPSDSPTASTTSTPTSSESPQVADGGGSGPASDPLSNVLASVNSDTSGVEIRVLNAKGKRLSALIAGRWLVEEINSDDFTARRSIASGQSVAVSVYIDGRFFSSKSLSVGTNTSESPTTGPTIIGPVNSASDSSTTSQGTAGSSESPFVAATGTTVAVSTENEFLRFKVLDGDGKRLSVKIGGRWFVTKITGDAFEYSAKSAEGQFVALSVFVDGKSLIQTGLTVGSSAAQNIVGSQVDSTSSTTQSGSTTSTSSNTVLSPEVQISSNNGKISVTVSGAKGQKVSVRVGGRWFVSTADSDDYEFQIPSLSGLSVRVLTYLNQVLVRTSQLRVS